MNSLYMPTGYDEILGLFSAEMRPILPDQTNKINIVVLNSERILSLEYSVNCRCRGPRVKESVVVIWLNKSTISILDFTSNATVYRCGRGNGGLNYF